MSRKAIEGGAVTPRRIKVLVVDDHEVVREGLSSLLSRELDIQVVGALASAEQMIEQLDALAPDVIVLDHRLGGICGAMACEEIVRKRSSTAVLILTSSVDETVLISGLMAGARGFLLKTAEPLDLVAGIRAVAQGQSVVAPEALDVLLGWMRAIQSGNSEPGGLSPDELAVLTLAARGWKNEEIAKHLKVTGYAVKARFTGAKKKLRAHERSEVVLAGIRQGVI
jgi:DNA-binding NarL/FixJ family response regulator